VPFIGRGGSSPPSDTYHNPTVVRVEIHFGPDDLLCGLVSQPQSYAVVDRGFVFGVGVLQDVSDVGQRGDDVLDVVF
jgi:hypothetical protein